MQKAKLIFNPASGNPAESALQLVELLYQLQAQQFQVEVLLVQPEHRLHLLARSAARAGTKMVIVSGGDGTIENVALGLVGSRTTLGIIPTGTRNNLARSLGIPTNNIAEAVALLRHGRGLKLDVGEVILGVAQGKAQGKAPGKVSRCFLEAGVVGLASALYSSSDDIQHGDFGKIGEFISTLLSAVPSEVHLRLDHHRKEVVARTHMVLVANMPLMGANFQVAPDVAFDDRHLDVFVYSDMSKRDLISQAMQLSPAEPDVRIQRFRTKSVTITTDPPMPVMADGFALGTGKGSVTMSLQPNRLRVMGGLAGTEVRLPLTAAMTGEMAHSQADDPKAMPHDQ
jgi:diacylglycerol kinase family enzyme